MYFTALSVMALFSFLKQLVAISAPCTERMIKNGLDVTSIVICVILPFPYGPHLSSNPKSPLKWAIPWDVQRSHWYCCTSSTDSNAIFINLIIELINLRKIYDHRYELAVEIAVDSVLGETCGQGSIPGIT
jgi:hypothetical protein